MNIEETSVRVQTGGLQSHVDTTLALQVSRSGLERQLTLQFAIPVSALLAHLAAAVARGSNTAEDVGAFTLILTIPPTGVEDMVVITDAGVQATLPTTMSRQVISDNFE